MCSSDLHTVKTVRNDLEALVKKAKKDQKTAEDLLLKLKGIRG